MILVPARGGSRRLPGKNLRPLCGRSLIAHTAEAVVESGLAVPVMLSTDDDAIAEEGRRHNMLVPFRRPAELAGDASPTVGAVLHALDWYRSRHGVDPERVMVLQPTSPLRGGRCLAEAMTLLDGRPEADSVIAMTALHVSAAHLFQADAEGMACAIGGGAAGPVFVPNGALYLTRTARLRAEGTLYAGRILPLPLGAIRAIDIDTEADWRMAEALVRTGAVAVSESAACGA